MATHAYTTPFTRRAALAGAALPLVGTLPAVAAPDADAGLHQLCAELHAADAEFDRLFELQLAAEVAGDRARDWALHHAAVALVPAFHDLLLDLADTPARTAPGLRAKLAVAVSRLSIGGDEPTDPDDVIVLAALRDVLALLG